MTENKKAILLGAPNVAVRGKLAELMGERFAYLDAPDRDTFLHLLHDRPDICGIFLDIGTPGFEGLALLQMVNGSRAWSRIPVVALSGEKQDPHVSMTAFRYGAVNVISLPLTKQEAPIKIEVFKSYLDKLASMEILSEAAETALQHTDPGEAISSFIAFIGRALNADKVCLYEDNMSGSFVRTYLWEREGCQPSTPESRIVSYGMLDLLESTITGSGRNVIIRSLKHFRRTTPKLYHILAKEGIDSLFGAPIYQNGRKVGFSSIINLKGESRQDAIVFLGLMNTFLAMQLRSKQQVERLKNTSFMDALTGASNRNALKLFSQSLDPESSLGILFCDLDKLKETNDTKGHEAGDRLIIDAASLLLAGREGGSVFRLGGDEFVVLWAGVPEDHFTSAVKALKKTFKEWDIPISMGSDFKEKAGCQFQHCLKAADTAMYQDKRQHHALADFVKSGSSEYAKALENHEFLYYLQPKLNLQTGKIIRAEALVRWEREGTLIEPEKFISGMEQAGFIFTFESWLWEEICQFLTDLQSEGIQPVPISVNLSARDFYLGDVEGTLERLLTRYHIPRRLLQLEIREKDYRSDPYVVRSVTRLHQAGYFIILDNFECTYKSLKSIQNITADALRVNTRIKIDVLDNPDGEVFDNVVDLAWKRGLYVEAEGIETKRQAEELQKKGCIVGQGFYWYRPMPKEKFAELLRHGDLVSYDTPEIRSSKIRKLTTTELLTEGLLTDDHLSELLGPMAILEETGDGLSLMQMNAPFAKLAGLSFSDNTNLDFMVRMEESKEFLKKAFHSAREHRDRGSTFVTRYLRKDKDPFFLFHRVHLIADDGARALYMDIAHEYVKRKDWKL